MNDYEQQYAVDADFEISGLELEIEDTRRDMRWMGVIASIAMVLIMSFGEQFVTKVGVYIAVAAIFILVGVKDHLYRNRVKAARSEMQMFKLLVMSELHRGRHTARILQVVRDPKA